MRMRLLVCVGVFLALAGCVEDNLIPATPTSVPAATPTAAPTPTAVPTPTVGPSPTPVPFTPLDMELVRAVAMMKYPHLALTCRNWRYTKKSGQEEFGYLGACYGDSRGEARRAYDSQERALVLALYLTNTSYTWRDMSYAVVDARGGIARLIKCDSSHDIPEPDKDCVRFVSVAKAKKEFDDQFRLVSSNFDQ